MPVEFLSDDQVAVHGQFSGPVSRAELERFFFLDDRDLELVGRRRGEGSPLDFGLQLGTLRFLGKFLDGPMAVPKEVDDFVASQLGNTDGSVLGSHYIGDYAETIAPRTSTIRGCIPSRQRLANDRYRTSRALVSDI